MTYRKLLDRVTSSRKHGSVTATLEDAMAEFIGAGSAVFLNSGTSAIHLALRLAAEEVYGSPLFARSGKQDGIAGRDVRCLDICSKSSTIGKGDGDGQDAFAVGKRESLATGVGLEGRRDGGMRPAGSLWGKRVFCPDLAPASLAYSILREGGEPVFIDISPCDWGMDPEALEIAFALYPDVRIVSMTHLHGFPGQSREIKDVCARHGAVLIEDASEALGASIGGRMAGSFGDYGILDFGKGKIVSGGAGGMLLLNRGSGAASLAVSEVIGIEAMGCFPSKTGVATYDNAYTGYGEGADGAACAALGVENAVAHIAKRVLSGLRYLPERIARKKEIYENYREMLDGNLMYMNPVGTGTEPNYWMPCITCESAIPFQEWRSENTYSYANPHGTSSPLEIHDALRASGIRSRPLYRPLSQQPAFRGCDQVSLDGSRLYSWESEARQDGDGREADRIEVKRKAADAASGMDCSNIADAPAKDASRKILGGISLPIISWESHDWSRQISSTGLCLPSGSGMTREEQERVAGIIYVCFDAGETGGFWKGKIIRKGKTYADLYGEEARLMAKLDM